MPACECILTFLCESTCGNTNLPTIDDDMIWAIWQCLQKGNVLESSGSQASFWMQMYTLTLRSTKNMSRDVGYYWLRLVIYILVSFCVGTIYYNVGTSYNAILVRSFSSLPIL